MQTWLESHPRLAQALTQIAIAVLVALLGLLGYDVNRLQPYTENRLAAQASEARSAAGAPSRSATMRSASAAASSSSAGDTNLTNLVLSGDLEVDGWYTLYRQTPHTVTAGLAITPCGSFQPLTATAPTTVTAIVAGDGGDLLVLHNVDLTDAITVTEGSALILSGDAALGPDDSLILLSDGDSWVELAQADN